MTEKKTKKSQGGKAYDLPHFVDSLERIDQKIEEVLELQRSQLGSANMAPQELVGFPQYTPGSIMVGVPKFFDYNHLSQVDDIYSGVADPWVRGRLLSWNAQMRYAQLSNDMESMCMFLQLQLEALCQICLPGLLIEDGCSRWDWSLSVKEVGGKYGVISFKKGEAVDLIPHGGLQIRWPRPTGMGYFVRVIDEESIADKCGDSVVDIMYKTNAMELQHRFATLLSVEVSGLVNDGSLHDHRKKEVMEIPDGFTICLTSPIPWADLAWLSGHWLWVPEKQILELNDELYAENVGNGAIAGVRYSKGIINDEEDIFAIASACEYPHLNLILPQPSGLQIREISIEGEVLFTARARVKEIEGGQDFIYFAKKKEILTGQWGVIRANPRFVIRNGKPVLMKRDGAICLWVNTLGKWQIGEKDSYCLKELMSSYKGGAHLSERIRVMMTVPQDDNADSGWSGSGSMNEIFKSISELRNNIVHGNMEKLKSSRSSLTMDDLTNFWDNEIAVRVPHWLHECGQGKRGLQ